MADKKRKGDGWQRRNRPEGEPFITPEAFEDLREDFERAIDRLTGYVRGVAEPWFSGKAGGPKPGDDEPRGFAPPIDLDEDEDAYHLSIELPGMTGEEVEIEARSGALVVSGEKRAAREGRISGGSWRERRFGAFRRVVPLPDDVEEKRIKASFQDGVLTIELPKIAKSRTKGRRIKIETG